MRPARPLWLYLTGLTLNVSAQWIARTGILIWVYSLTHSAPAVSLVGLMEAVPLLITAPLAGVLVDRLPYRQVLLASTVLQALLVLPLLLAQGSFAVPLILAVTLALGVLAQVFGTAASAIVPLLAGPARMGWVNSAGQVITGSVTAVAPGVAAAVVLVFGERGLVLALLLCWLAAVIALLGLPADTRQERSGQEISVGAQVRMGLAYAAGTPVVRDILVICFVAALGTGGLTVLHVLFATRALHLPPAAAGVLIGAVGAGQLAGGIVAMAVSRRLAGRYHLLLVGTLTASSASLAWYACSPSLAWAVPALFVRGLTLTLTVVSLTTMVQLATTPAFLGRVFSLVGATLAVAQLLSYALSGVLAEWVGIRPAIGLASATLILAAIFTGMRVRTTTAYPSEARLAQAALGAEQTLTEGLGIDHRGPDGGPYVQEYL